MYFDGSKFCGLRIYDLEDQCAHAPSNGAYRPEGTADHASLHVRVVTW